MVYAFERLGGFVVLRIWLKINTFVLFIFKRHGVLLSGPTPRGLDSAIAWLMSPEATATTCDTLISQKKA